MLEKKGIEKDRFSRPKGSTGRGYGQPAQPVGKPIDRLPLFGRGSVEECQKHSLSSSSLLFPVEVHTLLGRCPVEVRSRSGQCSVEATVTCHALIAPTASDPVDPLLVRSRLLFCCFCLPSLETYKLRAPLYLWKREHLHLFVYLLVLVLKALILFFVH